MAAEKKSVLVTVWTKFTVYWSGVLVDISQALAAMWTYVSNKEWHLTKTGWKTCSSNYISLPLLTHACLHCSLFALLAQMTQEYSRIEEVLEARDLQSNTMTLFVLALEIVDCRGSEITNCIFFILTCHTHYVVCKWFGADKSCADICLGINKVKPQRCSLRDLT